MTATLTHRPTPHAIAARTPADRNRYADLLRLGSLLVVVVGHWLMAGVVDDGRGLRAENVLVAQPWSQWLTWVFQVMPVFFFVGGYANATGWGSAQRRGTGYVDWLRARAGRLLRPAVPVVALWLPLAGLLALAGIPDGLLRMGTGTVMIPLWFLSVYIVVVALTPLTVALHRRFGAGAVAGMAVAAAGVDALHLAGVRGIGLANFVVVWAAVHQLGYLWRDGTLTRRPWTAPALLAGGLTGLVLLTAVAGYPVSMLGIDDAVRTNNSPPSVALVALGVMQVGALLVVRRPVERWLHRPRVWAGVVAGGSVAMSLYLWHMTAMVAVLGGAAVAGLLPARAYDATWWLTRPLWVAALAAALAPLVVLFRRFERPVGARPRATTVAAVVVSLAGVAGVCVGLALLIRDGLVVPGAPLGLPVVAVAALASGLVVLGVVRLPGAWLAKIRLWARAAWGRGSSTSPW